MTPSKVSLHSKKPIGQIETLEKRMLLSVSAALYGNGILAIQGSAGNDSVLVRQSGDNLLVTSSAKSMSFPMSRVREIRANLGAGTDHFSAKNINAPNVTLRVTTGTGARESTTVTGSAFALISTNATASIGTEVTVLNSSARSVVFAGGGWNDRLRIENSRVGSLSVPMGNGNDQVSVLRSVVERAHVDFSGGNDNLYIAASRVSQLHANFGTGVNEWANMHSNSVLGAVTIDARASQSTTVVATQYTNVGNLTCWFGNSNDTLKFDKSTVTNTVAHMGGGSDRVTALNSQGSQLTAFMGDGGDKGYLALSSFNSVYLDMGTGTREVVTAKSSAINVFTVQATASRGVSAYLYDVKVAGRFFVNCGNDNFGDTLEIGGVGTRLNKLVARMGGGNDRVVIRGGKVKNAGINLGAGNDKLFCYVSASVAGKANGSKGIDSYRAPSSLKITQFERRA